MKSRRFELRFLPRIIISEVAPNWSNLRLSDKIDWRDMEISATPSPSNPLTPETERLAYSIQESADLLGIHYFSVYRLIQRRKLRACRALRGKLLIPRNELLRLLKG